MFRCRGASAVNHQPNRIGELFRDAGDDTAAEELRHRAALRRADDQVIDAECGSEIENRRRRVLAHGVNWLHGNVAFRAGQKIEWDSANMRVTNTRAADPFLSRAPRAGWKLS